MSSEDNKMTHKASLGSQPIKRRSFLKLVLTGLVSFIPAASSLLKASPAYSSVYVPCQSVRCGYQGYYVCSNHILSVCEDEFCWDSFTGQFCYAFTHCREVGCC